MDQITQEHELELFMFNLVQTMQKIPVVGLLQCHDQLPWPLGTKPKYPSQNTTLVGKVVMQLNNTSPLYQLHQLTKLVVENETIYFFFKGYIWCSTDFGTDLFI